jgi:hypothetical protein
MKSARMTSINAIALFVALSISVSLAAQAPPTKQQKYSLDEIGTFGGPSSSFVGVGAHSVTKFGHRHGFRRDAHARSLRPELLLPRLLRRAHIPVAARRPD